MSENNNSEQHVNKKRGIVGFIESHPTLSALIGLILGTLITIPFGDWGAVNRSATLTREAKEVVFWIAQTVEAKEDSIETRVAAEVMSEIVTIEVEVTRLVTLPPDSQEDDTVIPMPLPTHTSTPTPTHTPTPTPTKTPTPTPTKTPTPTPTPPPAESPNWFSRIVINFLTILLNYGGAVFLIAVIIGIVIAIVGS